MRAHPVQPADAASSGSEESSRLPDRQRPTADGFAWLASPLVFWGLAAVASLQFAIAYVRTLPPEFPFEQYAFAHVEYPYRRRVLMQWVLRAAMHFGERLTYRSQHSRFTPVEICNIAVTAIAMLAAIAIASRWIQRIAGTDNPLRWLSLLVLWICNYHFLLVPEIRAQLPYDVPSVALFGLGCYAVYTRNRLLYYPTLIVASINRESALFLPFVFLLFQMGEAGSLAQAIRRTKPALWAETLLQLGIWAAIFEWCIWLTGGPGPPLHLLVRNLHLIAHPAHWPTYASILGFLWIPYVLSFRQIGDPRLQRIAWLALPWAGVMVVFADPLEIRTNSEWAVYMAVCMAAMARGWIVKRGEISAAMQRT